jgi:hypothetical protein
MSITVLHMIRQDELQHAAARNTPVGVLRDFVKFPYIDGGENMDSAKRVALRDDRQVAAATMLYRTGQYTPVATIATTDIDLAYTLTNNIDTSWAGEPDARVMVLDSTNLIRHGDSVGCASSSIGDLFRNNLNGEYFVCASCGFLSLGKLDAAEIAAIPGGLRVG